MPWAMAIIMMASVHMKPNIICSKYFFQGMHSKEHENHKTCGRGCKEETKVIANPNLANQVLVGP